MEVHRACSPVDFVVSHEHLVQPVGLSRLEPPDDLEKRHVGVERLREGREGRIPEARAL